MNTTTAAAPVPLQVTGADTLAAELGTLGAAPAPAKTVSAEVDAKAQAAADKLLSIDPTQINQADQAKASIESLGAGIAARSAAASKMLDQPLKELMQRGDDGGEVAKSLIDLKMQVEELDPAKFDFQSGALLRLVGKLPFVGTPTKRYFSRYQSAGQVIENIVQSLVKGREQLKRDNVTLKDDQKRMRELTFQLEQVIAVAQALDAKLSAALEQQIPVDDSRHKFLQEEILFPLRQVIQDRQQTLLVNQQGILTIEIVIRNNQELIRGVSRASDVTVAALRIAATQAIALTNQRIVLDKINAVNRTTEDLLAGNAERLRQQGVEIHKQASSAQLDIKVLGKAFEDIRAALDDISRFRQEALPKMAENILEMDRMTADQEKEIQKLEQAVKAKAAIKGDFTIDIVD